jgi:hypothetical protein
MISNVDIGFPRLFDSQIVHHSIFPTTFYNFLWFGQQKIAQQTKSVVGLDNITQLL